MEEAPHTESIPFEDFPEDVQLTILSFLPPNTIASFGSTSRRFLSLCAMPKLWYSMCERRWGSHTSIRNWTRSGTIPFSSLYRTLDRWESLIGFWRRIGSEGTQAPILLFFEWGPSFITGYKVSPANKVGSYDVLKIPFLWMGLSRNGDPLGFVCTGCRFQSVDHLLNLLSCSGFSHPELVPVTVDFAEENYFIVQECTDFYCSNGGRENEAGVFEDLSASPPDRLMSEIYQYFANRTSPGADRATRRQRKKERGRLGRKKTMVEHYMKITNSYPTPSRPFQGLWKGISKEMELGFYLIIYNDNGGIGCRLVGDSSESFSGFSIFWSSETKLLEFPFSGEGEEQDQEQEEDIYNSRHHIHSVNFDSNAMDREVVSRILRITSSVDLVFPGVDWPSDGCNGYAEGRIWQYKSGSFGFGFLKSDFIIDLKHIALNGRLLDAVEYSIHASSSSTSNLF